MNNKKVFLGLDVGGQRIGVAHGDSIARLASMLPTIQVNGSEETEIQHLVRELGVTDIVIGRPRNQSGDRTAQTDETEQFAARVVEPLNLAIHWQDESLTSVTAEQQLQQSKKPYTKADIDAMAAAIILQDYLETV